MYTELGKCQFSLVQPLIRGTSTYLSLPAIVEGKSRGRIWGNDVSDPSSAIVWDLTNGFLFILATSNSKLPTSEMNLLLRDRLGPIAKEMGYSKLYAIILSKTVKSETHELFKGMSVENEDICHFYLKREDQIKFQEANIHTRIHNNSRLVRISRSILETRDLTNISEVRRCIIACWQSLNDYLSDGIGFVLLKNNAVASWCSTDYIVSGKCDLYVETFKDHKQKGFGTIVTLACVKECLNQKLEINWHCWNGNLPSIKLAQKIGFLQRPNQSIHTISL